MTGTAAFSHVCIVSAEPLRLAAFYEEVFDCGRVGPERRLGGAALEAGMGVTGIRVSGVHLSLPGGNTGTLEIFSPGEVVSTRREVSSQGLMHLSFIVDDIEDSCTRLRRFGGRLEGVVSEIEVAGVGTARFVYARDPEGNLVELQEWLSRRG